MKLLCGVLSCWWRESYTNCQRDTWAKPTEGIDIRFFFGRGANRPPKEDEVFLDCADDYKGLPEKVRAMCRWAYENGYDYVFKVDDDTYIVPSRLVTAVPVGHDWVGRYQAPIKGDLYPYGFCSGGAGYWLSRRAVEILINAQLDDPHFAEDRWVSNTLGKHGIIGQFDSRYRAVLLRSDPRVRSGIGLDTPRAANNYISVCEFAENAMYEPHKLWTNSQNHLAELRNKLKIK